MAKNVHFYHKNFPMIFVSEIFGDMYI